MNQVIFCGFRNIKIDPSFFRDSLLRKGRKLYLAGHVDSVVERCTTNSDTKITASCLPTTSVRNKNYHIILTISSERDLKLANCSCKAGINGKCKHAAAVAIYVNEFKESTKTDQKQAWGIPAVKEGYSKGKKLVELFPKLERSHVLVPKTDVNVSLSAFPDVDCPLSSILMAENETKLDRDCKDVLDVLITGVCEMESTDLLEAIVQPHANFQACFNYRALEKNGKTILTKEVLKPKTDTEERYYLSKVAVSRSDVIKIAISTKSQSQSPLWLAVRSVRLSSSIAHQVVTRQDRFEELAVRMLNVKFTGNQATRYGSQLEKAARASFCFKNQKPVLETGVIICTESPWLCCSPDGLYYHNSEIMLLEIKCPHSRKGQPISSNDHKSYVPYITHNGKEWILKRNHKYYTQVQVAMFVLKLKSCSFFIYSSVDSLTIHVNRDEEFLTEYIPKLEWFYFNYYLQALSQ